MVSQSTCPNLHSFKQCEGVLVIHTFTCTSYFLFYINYSGRLIVVFHWVSDCISLMSYEDKHIFKSLAIWTSSFVKSPLFSLALLVFFIFICISSVPFHSFLVFFDK